MHRHRGGARPQGAPRRAHAFHRLASARQPAGLSACPPPRTRCHTLREAAQAGRAGGSSWQGSAARFMNAHSPATPARSRAPALASLADRLDQLVHRGALKGGARDPELQPAQKVGAARGVGRRHRRRHGCRRCRCCCCVWTLAQMLARPSSFRVSARNLWAGQQRAVEVSKVPTAARSAACRWRRRAATATVAQCPQCRGAERCFARPQDISRECRARLACAVGLGGRASRALGVSPTGCAAL